MKSIFKYTIYKIIRFILSIFIVSVIAFVTVYLSPEYIEPDISKGFINQQISENKLDIYIISSKYYNLMYNIFAGNLGYSETLGFNIKELIPSKILITLKITLPSLIISIVLSILLSIILILNEKIKFIQNILYIIYSIPYFWFAYLLIYILSYKLEIFSSNGVNIGSSKSFISSIEPLILPILVISLHTIGGWVKFIRPMVDKVMQEKYILAAISRGIPKETIIIKHAIKNVLPNIMTVVSLNLISMFQGTLIIEKIFSIPGMGLLLFDSIIYKDTNLVIICTLVLTFITLTINTITDILYKILYKNLP